jgi:tRNA pseudouridine38-40 synthase
VKAAFWEHRPTDYRLIFSVTANRFLRGMVRLIVGTCFNVGLGKIELSDVKAALDEQKPVKKSLSVPPQGLFLTEVKYPF